MESFPRGHGFLRPLEKGIAGVDDVDEPLPSGLERGAYVAPSQMERFALKDGDVVRALVRPPRDVSHRRSFSARSDSETSWAIRRILDVNGGAPQDQGPGDRSRTAHIVESQSAARDGFTNLENKLFEWTGVMELRRMQHHGFLRPLLDDSSPDGRDEASPSVVGAEGVFVPVSCIKAHDLLDDDVVRAMVGRPRSGKGQSYELFQVIEVVRRGADEAGRAGGVLMLTGLYESFKFGYGFVRPFREDVESGDLQHPCLERGAYVGKQLADRWNLKDGDKLTAKVKLPLPGQKSAMVLAIVDKFDEEGAYADNVWGLLAAGGGARHRGGGNPPLGDDSPTSTPLAELGLRLARIEAGLAEIGGFAALSLSIRKLDERLTEVEAMSLRAAGCVDECGTELAKIKAAANTDFSRMNSVIEAGGEKTTKPNGGRRDAEEEGQPPTAELAGGRRDAEDSRSKQGLQTEAKTSKDAGGRPPTDPISAQEERQPHTAEPAGQGRDAKDALPRQGSQPRTRTSGDAGGRPSAGPGSA